VERRERGGARARKELRERGREGGWLRAPELSSLTRPLTIRMRISFLAIKRDRSLEIVRPMAAQL